LVAGSNPAGGAITHCEGFVELRIRDFELRDYESVVELWEDAGLIIRPGDDRDGIELKLQRDADLFLVAVDGDAIIGVVLGAWDGRRGWINHLAVKPGYQRRGIGKLLISELEKRFKKKGATKVNAQICKENTRSLDFFKAEGYDVHTDLIMIGKVLIEK
jgi:ribosomal protein S18 acetylase RimI-like enzyme